MTYCVTYVQQGKAKRIPDLTFDQAEVVAEFVRKDPHIVGTEISKE